MTQKITAFDIDHAQRIVEEGNTVINAARIINCSPDILSKKLRARGVIIKKRIPYGCNKRTDVPEPAVISDYISGQSVLSISIKYGCSRFVINRILSENDICCRNGSEANILRMQRLSIEARQKLVFSAREKRADNMIIAAHDSNINNPAIGKGEREIADALEKIGHKIIRQKRIGNYLIDFTIGDIAVEIRFMHRGAFTPENNLKRSEYIIKNGYRLIFVAIIASSICITQMNDIASAIDSLCRLPPERGQYWMIRSHIESVPVGQLKAEQTSRIGPSPHFVTVIKHGYLCIT